MSAYDSLARRRAEVDFVVRVIAAGAESRLQSRPRWSAGYLLQIEGRNDRFVDLATTWDYGRRVVKNVIFFRYDVPIMLHRGILGQWLDEDYEIISQGEAERIASSLWTPRHAVRHVSDVAIKFASDLYWASMGE